MHERCRLRGSMAALGKRIDGVGGRRSAVREPLLLRAAMTSLYASRMIAIVNISTTGARVRGPDLPEAGQDVLLRFASIEALGIVAWQRGELAGVVFDDMVSDAQLEQLRRYARHAQLTKLTPEERTAAEHFRLGLTR